MSPDKFFTYKNGTQEDPDIAAFEALEPDDGLPYPLNLTRAKVFLSSTLVMTLVCGFRLRYLIFRYLKTIDFKVSHCGRL